MKPLEQRLDDQLKWFLDHGSPVFPKVLEDCNHVQEFVARLKKILLDTSVFLDSQCLHYANHDEYQYQLDETHYWLLYYRFSIAWNMWGTLKVFPPYANTPVAVQLCNDAEMMAWLLIPVLESFGEQWFLAD